MRLENKRYLEGFEKTTDSFFQRNFDYHSQKFIIDFIIRNVCWKYFKKYREYLDEIVESLINKTEIDVDIDNYLKDCFLTKLKNFSKDYRIDIKINPQETIDLKLASFNEEYIIPKKIEIIDNFNEDKKVKGVNKKNKINEEKWFPFKSKTWKNLSPDSQNSLTVFMENMFEYQDSYFLKKDPDNVFESLKNYQFQDLTNFFESKKKYFINEINNDNKLKNINPDKIYISKIILSKQFKDTFMNKIRKEINRIKNQKELCKIDYLSIIIIGKTRVGKSTLTNAMLKEKLAPIGKVEITTLVNKAYKSNNMPFLRIFDTRGIEMDPNFGPQEILKGTLKTIKKEEQKIENSSNLNDYIQCIWYCISNNGIEDTMEIEIIKELKQKEESVPIIFLHTYSFDEEKVQRVKSKIKAEFNDIVFIPVLAEPIKGVQDSHIFGLDDLLNETLKIYKKTKKGNIYKKIKKIYFPTIIKDFKNFNNSIKISLINKIVDKFTHDFNKVMDDEEFLKYIYNLLEIIFVEYLKYGEKDEKIELTQENKEYIKNITTIQKNFSSFHQVYKEKIEEIIKKIYDQKAIEYLDEQVRKEKKEFSKCLNKKNKCNKNDFKNNIETFLNNNFTYLSQKYIIYRLITDACEQIIDYVEILVNNLINKLIEKNPDIFDKIYYQKIDDLEKEIKFYRKNGKIYEHDSRDVTSSISKISERINGNAAPVP